MTDEPAYTRRRCPVCGKAEIKVWRTSGIGEPIALYPECGACGARGPRLSLFDDDLVHLALNRWKFDGANEGQ